MNSIKRYLLGDLSEQEREHFEQLLMSDDAFYEQLLFAEDDLIDDYIFGTLADEERSRFKKRFLHVPELRQSVNFTEVLRKHALQTAPQAVVVERAPPRPSLLDHLRKLFMQPAAGVAFAALLLGAVALDVWLIKQNSQLRSRVEQIESQQTAPPDLDLQQKLELAQKRNEELLAENQRQQQLLAEASRKPEVQEPTPRISEPQGTGILAVTLLSGGVRDPGAGTKTIELPANTKTVRFELDIAPGDYKGYSAVLETAEGQPKWSNKNLKFTKSNVVPFEVPARVLIRGDYNIVLAGVKSSGARDEVDRYTFRVK